MNYAFNSLWRNRGRYLLFGILFILLGAAWSICLLLGQTSEEIHKDLLDQYGTAVILDEIGFSTQTLDEAICERFNDPALVESMEYIGYTQANVIAEVVGFNERKMTTMVGLDYTTPYNPLTRRANPFALVQGKLVETDNECLVFEDTFALLKRNGIIANIGDTVKIRSYTLSKETYDNMLKDGNAFFSFFTGTSSMPFYHERELVIVGTVDRDSVDDYRYQIKYSTITDPKTGEPKQLKDIPLVFFVTINEAKQYPTFGENEAGVLATNINSTLLSPKYEFTSRLEVIYHLKSFDDLPAFREKVRAYNHELVDEKLYALYEFNVARGATYSFEEYKNADFPRQNVPAYNARPYLDGFDQLVEPLNTLGKFTRQMSINLTLLAAALFVILTVLNLYSRTYEIGVLRCVGMSRLRISLNLMLEHGIFLLASLLLGVGVSALIANTAIPHMLDAAYRDYLQNALSGLPAAAGAILLTGFVLTLLASVGAAVYIQRYRPLKILRNRS